SLVRLDGQRTPRVSGSFGQVPGQSAASLSRGGQLVASIITERPGAPDMASTLWVGPLGGDASQAMDGRSLSRPSWSLDDAIWVVVDGINVVRVIQDASGQPARIPVDSASVSTRFPGPIAELQLSRDGTRAAMVIEGRVILAGVEQTEGGGYALTFPRRLGYGLRDTVVSLSWRTGDDIVVSRTDAQHPVAYVNLDGVNSDGPTYNLLRPVTTVAANPSAVYVADARGVLQLSGSTADGDPGWAEVRPLMTAGALPVLPG
ncbi:MAG: LpqB family beta-propeller domain-containing protein, partial [Mycobacterium sp.]